MSEYFVRRIPPWTFIESEIIRFLVEWNQVLFDTFVPEAWAELLRQLSLHANFDQPNDIFFAWPPQSQDTPGGDPAYWQPLARCLVRIVADKQLEIWPLVKGQNTPLFGSIQNSLIAQSHDLPFLPALATAGVRISQPPAYISEMVSTLDGVAKQLSPQNTREAILVRGTSS